MEQTQKHSSKIALIWAMDENRLIGKDNAIPWRLPAEQAYFKQTTMGHAVVMGRLTYESIGRPLPGRSNYVLSRNATYQAPGCTVVSDLTPIFEKHAGEEIFIMGGSQVYAMMLPMADRLYVTRIQHAFEGDSYFPVYDESEWVLTARTPGIRDEKNPHDYTFECYERRHMKNAPRT